LYGDAYFGDGLIADDICVPSYPMPVPPMGEDDPCKGYDVYFSQLTEQNDVYDIYPEILIGRIPADSTANVINSSIKLRNYEPINVTTGYNGWKDRYTFINSAYPSYADDAYELILPLLPYASEKSLLTNETYNYASGVLFTDIQPGNEIDVSGAFSEGNAFITYFGHGFYPGWDLFHDIYETEWQYGDIPTVGGLPFLLSGSCNTGNFESYDDGYTEKTLCANSVNGCIAHIGASEPSNGSDWEEFFYHIFNGKRLSLTSTGELLLFAKLMSSNRGPIDYYNLFSDPALNFFLDSENINYVDFFCNPLEIAFENINNQSLRITAGIDNLSGITYPYDIEVKCILSNEFLSENYEQDIIISQIGGGDHESAIFNFDISNFYPSEYVASIIVDSFQLIDERNEFNNEASKSYDLYKELDNFPITIDNDEYRQLNSPLFWDNSILTTGKKIDCSGNVIWDSNIDTESIFMPLFHELDQTYYYITINSDDEYMNDISLINGSDGSLVSSYNQPDVYKIDNYLTDDINNDGIDEIIVTYHNPNDLDNTGMLIFDNNLILQQTIMTPDLLISDIATGDSNGNGLNEIFVTFFYSQNLIRKYEYDNVELELSMIDERILTNLALNLNLFDYSDNGALDCLIYSSSKITILDAQDLESGNIVTFNLAGYLYATAIGDIDNDGDCENVYILTDGTVHVIDSGVDYILFSIPTDPTRLVNKYDGLTLLDLNEDQLLDVILNTGETILAFQQNGDPLFEFPSENSLSNSLIKDIDNDNDVDIIYSLLCDNFGSYTSSTLMVSDINPDVSNHGNLYPKMNEFHNNRYSQPVSGVLIGDTDFYWSGSITLSGEVILPVLSSLTIQPGTIIKARENSKLTCYGDFYINGTENQPVIFEAAIYEASQNYWQGLDFPVSNNDVVINNLEICGVTIHSIRDLEITGGKFINTSLIQEKKNLHLTNVEFDNSPINVSLYATPNMETVCIENCHIANAIGYAGIEITGYPNFNITGNVIEGCQSGIKIWESGSGIVNTISNNIIRNNTQEYGLFAYHSFIDILGYNTIENNKVGIFIVNNSNFNLIGSENYPLQVVRNNIQNEIRFHYDSRPGQFYYNNIYDTNHDYSYVKCERIPSLVTSIGVKNNYWGTTFNPNTDLSPTSLFIYLPVWDPGVPKDSESGSPETMFLSAQQSVVDEEYEEAEQAFKQIITLYPESEFAKIAAKELLALKVKYDQDFLELKLYYQAEPNMQYDNEMIKLSSYLINCCSIKLEEYQEAITWFEEIIQNPPSTVDSVFAVIDAGYTYMVMENTGRSDYTGQIKELKPKSSKQYSVIRDNLLKQLFRNNEPDNDIPEITEAALYSNYPNPFNPMTTISFALPEESEVSISIYNIKGQKVKVLVDDIMEKGQHKIVWDGLNASGRQVASGVYLYNMQTKDYSSTKKMLMIK
ncbi:MAG: T9SS type A sorting domain-containing protein, partial [Candidatus Cloacimonetes bacterium]|nr:T9SS type A sorting domain-containing protein [Candidatus Cloacimonadota bacterium]